MRSGSAISCWLSTKALANSAEFAYVTMVFGTVSVEAVHSAVTGSLVVVIADHGVWYDEDPTERSHARGRGISLMETLSDDVTFERLADGTRVRLLFADCAAVPKLPGALSARLKA